MLNPVIVLSGLAVVGALSAFPGVANAQGQRTIECSSSDGKRKSCAVSDINPASVRMERKLSDASCVRGRNWDADTRGIWVKDGCRARFTYGTGGADNWVQGGAKSIECNSHDNKRKHCAVSNVEPGSVRMADKLSDAGCRKGTDWGSDGGGVWVDNGCRARFTYATRSGGLGDGGTVVPSDVMKQACVRRAMKDWSVTEENLTTALPREVGGGRYEVRVASKRTTGFCTLDKSGKVLSLKTQ